MKSLFSILALLRMTAPNPRPHRSRCPRWLRVSAFLGTLLFVWSFVLSTPVYALTHQPPVQRVGVRVLTPEQMQKIVGRQSSPPSHVTAVSPNSGDTYPWEASAG